MQKEIAIALLLIGSGSWAFADQLKVVDEAGNPLRSVGLILGGHSLYTDRSGVAQAPLPPGRYSLQVIQGRQRFNREIVIKGDPLEAQTISVR